MNNLTNISLDHNFGRMCTVPLKAAGCDKIFIDHISGKTKERPGWKQLIDMVHEGDTLVVWRLDRLGRSLRHLIDIIKMLEEMNVGFKTLQESIDTTISGGKLIFHIFAALAEFERNLIQERTQAGLRTARVRGRNGGRPKSLNPKKRELTIKLYKRNIHSIKDICTIMKISKQTLYNYLKEDSILVN